MSDLDNDLMKACTLLIISCDGQLCHELAMKSLLLSTIDKQGVCYFEAYLLKLEDVRRSRQMCLGGSVLGEGLRFLNSVVVLSERESCF